MKRVALEQLPPEVADWVISSQRERVVITRNGEAYALVVGVENKDAEDLELEFSPEFWRMIDESRRSKVRVSLDDIEAELEGDESRERQAESPAKQ